MKRPSPTRNFIVTYSGEDIGLVNKNGSALLDLIASYGGIINFVKPQHDEDGYNYLDVSFKILTGDVEEFLNEEQALSGKSENAATK